MPDKVLAVIVTHNRLNLLKRCIYYLQKQSTLPDILIINNESTDGTEKFLSENNIGHITQSNEGSSAGWARGISEGISKGYSFVWLMDDDGYPHHRALELLLENTDEHTACISSVVVKEKKHDEFVFGMSLLNRKGNPVVFSLKRKYYTFSELPAGVETYPFVHLFNGALINLEYAAQIDNVDRDYFIYGDEVDYYCRLRKVGNVFSLLSALHYHPDVNQRVIDKMRVYYFIRNSIIINRKYFDLVIARNFFTVFVTWWRILKRNGFLNSLTYVFGANTKYFYYGIRDGIKGNFIKRF